MDSIADIRELSILKKIDIDFNPLTCVNKSVRFELSIVVKDVKGNK